MSEWAEKTVKTLSKYLKENLHALRYVQKVKGNRRHYVNVGPGGTFDWYAQDDEKAKMLQQIATNTYWRAKKMQEQQQSDGGGKGGQGKEGESGEEGGVPEQPQKSLQDIAEEAAAQQAKEDARAERQARRQMQEAAKQAERERKGEEDIMNSFGSNWMKPTPSKYGGATSESDHDRMDYDSWAREYIQEFIEYDKHWKKDVTKVYPHIILKPWEVFPKKLKLTDCPIVLVRRQFTSGYINDVGHSKIYSLVEVAEEKNIECATYDYLFERNYSSNDEPYTYKGKKYSFKGFMKAVKNKKLVFLTCGCTGGSIIPSKDELSKYFRDAIIVTNYHRGSNCGCSTLRRMDASSIDIRYGILR